MPKARKTRKMPAATLLSLHSKCINDKFSKPGESEEQEGIKDQHDSGQRINDPLIAIKELQAKIAQEFELSRSLEQDAPPLLHICVQYCGEVVQTRYEKSVFSSIIHEADNIVDKVTGDEDDSDFESLMEVDDEGSSVFGGLGLSGSNASPELRILIIKITDAHKICQDAVVEAKATVTYHSPSKTSNEKTKRRKSDYRHTIGFNHVFTFRGATIEQLCNSDVKISIKVYSPHTSDEAFVILSNQRCVMEERLQPSIQNQFVTNPSFWKEYLEKHSEELFKFTIPLVCPNRPDFVINRGSLPTLATTPETDSSESHSNESESRKGSPDIMITHCEPTENEPDDEPPSRGRSPSPVRTANSRSRSPSPKVEPVKSRTPSPARGPKSRTSSSDSAASAQSGKRKKGRFSLGKITKIFS